MLAVAITVTAAISASALDACPRTNDVRVAEWLVQVSGGIEVRGGDSTSCRVTVLAVADVETPNSHQRQEQGELAPRFHDPHMARNAMQQRQRQQPLIQPHKMYFLCS